MKAGSATGLGARVSTAARSPLLDATNLTPLQHAGGGDAQPSAVPKSPPVATTAALASSPPNNVKPSSKKYLPSSLSPPQTHAEC